MVACRIFLKIKKRKKEEDKENAKRGLFSELAKRENKENPSVKNDDENEDGDDECIGIW